MSSYNRIIDELTDLVQFEHCEGCGEDHCDINASFDTGHALWAIDLFDSSGAASERFEILYARLIAQYGGRFTRAANTERAHLIATVETLQCEGCNAYTWLTDYTDTTYYAELDARCGSCAGFIHGDSAQGDGDAA